MGTEERIETLEGEPRSPSRRRVDLIAPGSSVDMFRVDLYLAKVGSWAARIRQTVRCSHGKRAIPTKQVHKVLDEVAFKWPLGRDRRDSALHSC